MTPFLDAILKREWQYATLRQEKNRHIRAGIGAYMNGQLMLLFG